MCNCTPIIETCTNRHAPISTVGPIERCHYNNEDLLSAELSQSTTESSEPPIWKDPSPCTQCTHQKRRLAHAILVHHKSTVDAILATYFEMEPAAANDMIPGMIEFSRSQGMSVKTSSELFTQQFKDHKRVAQRRYQAVTGQISQAMQALRELKVAEDDIAESKPLVAAILYLYSLRMRDQ